MAYLTVLGVRQVKFILPTWMVDTTFIVECAKWPPSTKNMHTKDGHDSRGRNYKAETQLPTFAWASLPI